MARISNLYSPTDTSITVLVQLDQGSSASSHYIYIYCSDGQSSGDLGYQYSSSNPHWSREVTFYGLTPGTTYTFTASVSPYVYVPSNSYTTTGTRPQPPSTPSMNQWSASGRNITMQVWNTGNATSLNFYTSWDGRWSYGHSPNSTYYYFTAPQYGGHYEIWVEGVNYQGTSQVKKAYAYSVPNSPVLSLVSIANNTARIGVSTSGYYDSIEVEMYTSTGSYYTSKYLSWDGSLNRYGELTFSALTQGASYTFKAKGIDNSGYTSPYSNNLNITNLSPPTTPLARQHSASGKYVTVIIDNYYTATSIKYLPSWTGVWETDYNRYSTRSWTVPEYGTDYIVTVRGNNSAGDSGDKNVYVTSEPVVPTITGTTSNNRATITARVSSGGFSSILVQMLDQYAVGVIEEKTFTYNNQAITFNSTLVPNATYQFRAKAFKTSVNFNPESAWGGYYPLKNNVARPPNWSWATAKTSGQPFKMTAKEWNDFTTKVNAFREYKELSAYNFTYVYSGGTFYFYIFNEAVASINQMRTTGLGNVSSGNKVFASYFNTLSSTLNGIS